MGLPTKKTGATRFNSEPMSMEFEWELEGEELNALSRVMHEGKVLQVTEDDALEYLSGVLDGLISSGLEEKKLRFNFKKAIAVWRAEGATEYQVKARIRGWQGAGKILGLDEDE